MSNLVSKNGGAMVAADFWGNMDTSDFSIPHVKIGQPMSKKGKAGEYNFSNGATLPVIKGVSLLVPMKTRVLYGKGLNDKARCSSDNYHTPATRILEPISPSCLNCFAKEWGDEDPRKVSLARELERKGNIKSPLCKDTYNPMLVTEDGKPFFIQFQGLALKVVSEQLLSRLRYDFARVPPFLVAFDMGLTQAKDTEYKVYIPTFENFRVLDGEAAEKMQNLWSAYSESAASRLAEAHAQMDADKDEVPF